MVASFHKKGLRSALFLLLTGLSLCHELPLLVLQESGRQSENGFPVGAILPEDSPVYKLIIKELSSPFHQRLLRLNRLNQALVGQEEQPTVLYVSTNEGGYARKGIAIENNGEIQEYPELGFVDLSLNEEKIRFGGLHIFSHELGHVMMSRIFDQYPESYPESKSTRQHASMAITDYSNAFTEGFGIHFQRLHYESSGTFRRIYEEGFQPDRFPNRLWHSGIDRELRIENIISNEWIHETHSMLKGQEFSSSEARLTAEYISPVFDRTKLKEAAVMLSNEGVLATLFYRIAKSPTLRRNRPEKKEFVKAFLFPGEKDKGEVFRDNRNIPYLKMFYVWREMARKPEPDLPLSAFFVREWCWLFPEDRREIISLFILTTMGTTTESRLPEIYESMAISGIMGDIPAYREAVSAFTQEYRRILASAIENPELVIKRIPPEIWTDVPGVSARKVLWVPGSVQPLSINLNTATEYELSLLPGMNLEKAAEFIALRRRNGGFSSLSDAQKALD